MNLLVWLALASFIAIAYTYIGYPLVICMLAKLSPKPWLRAPYATTVSVVIAARNGGSMLSRQLARLAHMPDENLREIIVVSDGSTDNTVEILRNCKDERLKFIVLDAHEGKSSALNHAIAQATEEILLFLDVRPTMNASALSRLVENFADPAVGCATGQLLLNRDGHDASTSAVNGLYWRYEQWIRNCESAWDSPLGVYGGFYAIRRSLATAFPSGLILDDMFQPLAVTRQGFRSVIDKTAIVTDTWPTNIRDEFGRKVRTLAGNYQLLAGQTWILCPTNRLWFQLVSHKMLRLVMPYCFITLLISSMALAIHHKEWIAFAAAQWSFWTMACIGTRLRIPGIFRLSSAAGAFLVVNAAAVVGLYRFLFTAGPLLNIWTTSDKALPPAPKKASASA